MNGIGRLTALDAGSANREDDPSPWLYSAPLAALLFCGALAIFALGYLPEAQKARECEARVAEARRRIRELRSQEEEAGRRIAELEAGVSDAVEEAAREVYHLGGGGDFLPGGR